MMRLRILELPAEVVGETVTTPFVLVVDRAGADARAELVGQIEAAKRATGARGVLVFAGEVDLASGEGLDAAVDAARLAGPEPHSEYSLGDYLVLCSLHREDDGIDDVQVCTIATPGMTAERQSQLIERAVLSDA